MPTVDERAFVSYMRLRQAIGVLGLVMPIIVRVGAWWFEGIESAGSISAYYYTSMRDVFVGTLVLVGTLLACYRTGSPVTNWLASICGIGAMGIGLFPMDPEFAPNIVATHPEVLDSDHYIPRGLLGYHFCFVVLFFAVAFYLVAFSFRSNTTQHSTARKHIRNKVYLVCAVVMLGSGIVLGVMAFVFPNTSIFWPESIAVAAFAIAWLVKGQAVIGDG